MSVENQGGQPVATATPGSPIHVNVQMPSSTSEKPVAEKAARGEKRAAAKKVERAAERAHEKGGRDVIKALGVPKEERAGLLKEIAKTREAKSLTEKIVGEQRARADKLETELKAARAELGIYKPIATRAADEEFNALDENVQRYIAKKAGDSLETRLQMITELKENGMITKQEAAAQAAQAKTEAKPVKPATTSVAANPKAPPPNATPTPRQQYEALKAQNPRMAAQFYSVNRSAIDSDWR